ncbi:hypothetical protein QTP70_009592 [Hemibagrus guttatus]|uniref:ribonuclease H n=1 Tax=Hemibagrus guttatus TaxID=175788 RepID=A0AAE0UPQ8_9TELE|nr:hypothetical protein QTP70_009592 [Hemibagrus guttatus]
MLVMSTNFIPDRSRPGLTTTAIGTTDLQSAGGNWATVGRRSRGGRRVVQDMYERSRTVVRCAVGQTEEFKVEVGLHQGSALSPFLFAMVMDQLSEEVRQESPWTMMFTDDIVICNESREQVEQNLERWRFALERRGMKVSCSKTEYMCVNESEGSGTVRLQGEEVKKVQEFKYLGSKVQSNGECGKEVKKRVQADWNGWRKVSGVLCDSKISVRIKGKVYRTVVGPIMLYGSETVSLRKRQEAELEVAELKMLSVESPECKPVTIPSCYQDLQEVFSKTKATQLPPHHPWDCAIDLLPNAMPPKSKIYPLSRPETQAMEDYIEEADFIRPSTSPAAAGFFFMEKKDRGLRPCIDYRVPAALEQLREAKIYTKLDLSSAYNLIRLKEGDEWKTAFLTTRGHYEYRVMPYGLANAPAVFQSFINEIFRDILNKYVVAYIDDILIYSKSEEEHQGHVRTVLTRLLENQLYVKAEKCEFHVQRTSFLGYNVSCQGVEMGNSKITAVTEWPRPTTVKELQRFLGFANFYRHFIRNYSITAAPLTSLLKGKPSRLKWTENATQAFTNLNSFTTTPILKHPDPNLPFVVEVDASDSGIGAVLSQRHGQPGKLFPCAYFSRKLMDAERNYDVGNKELLAMKVAIEEWRHWLEGSTHPFQGTPEAAEAYQQAKRAAAQVVSEAKTRVSEEFGEAMEKDYQTALGKFWQTVWCLRSGKQLSTNTVYSGGGELLASTGDIVGQWKEYFEDLLNPTDTSSLEKPEAEDSDIDSFITQVVQQLLSGKAPGVDEIRREYLKSLDVVGLSWLTHLCNIVWWSGTVPLDWVAGVVVPLFKKLFFLRRGTGGHGRLGQLYTLHRVLEGSWEFAQPVHMCFVDLEKAFDRVPRDILWEVLWEYGVRGPLLRAVWSLYDQSRSLVRIASYDVVLLAPSSQDLQRALGHFPAECEVAGMRVSTSKSEAMVLNWKKVACTLQVLLSVIVLSVVF